MRAKLRDNKGITLVVVLMTMAILLSVIGAGLLFSGINTKITGNYQRVRERFTSPMRARPGHESIEREYDSGNSGV